MVDAGLMQTVSIGGFHDDIVGLVNIFRITDQRFAEISDVAGEYQFFRNPVFGDK